MQGSNRQDGNRKSFHFFFYFLAEFIWDEGPVWFPESSEMFIRQVPPDGNASPDAQGAGMVPVVSSWRHNPGAWTRANIYPTLPPTPTHHRYGPLHAPFAVLAPTSWSELALQEMAPPGQSLPALLLHSLRGCQLTCQPERWVLRRTERWGQAAEPNIKVCHWTKSHSGLFGMTPAMRVGLRVCVCVMMAFNKGRHLRTKGELCR